MGKGKHPTSCIVPTPKKQPKGEPRPEKIEDQLLWSFRLFDPHEWGSGLKQDGAFHNVASHLRDLERMDWSQLMQTNQHCHAVDLSNLPKKTQNRLTEIHLDDQDSLCCLRCTGTNRVWGIREGHVFIVVWWDPDHKVCPSLKKHT